VNDILPDLICDKCSKTVRCAQTSINCTLPLDLKFELYPEEKIWQNMEHARESSLNFHGSFASLMDEVFLNASDLMMFKVCDGVDPLEITRMAREYFPHATKVSSFMSSNLVNKVGYEYLRRLAEARNGPNRIYIGIESGDYETSSFLGKRESAEDNLRAMDVLRRAGFRKIKPIFMVGQVGKGFYNNKGDFISSKKGLDATAEFISVFLDSSREDKVQISRYKRIPGTPLDRMHEEGKIIIPYADALEQEEDLAYLLARLKQLKVDPTKIELNYEAAVQSR
jgi:hypothetical protein